MRSWIIFYWICPVVSWTTNRLQRGFPSFALTPLRARTSPDDLSQDLKAKASQLRQEAEALESTLSKVRPRPNDGLREDVRPVPQYSSLEDSIWTVSYRFTSDPVSDDDEAERPDSFGGQVLVQLLSDGYTKLISQQSSVGKPLKILKCWGWDLENSSDDNKDYLLFSMDAELPDNEVKRFYLQARQERRQVGATSNVIHLEEGTVTVKKDVVPESANGIFGFLSPKGILAQFRLVGGFVAKPSSGEE